MQFYTEWHLRGDSYNNGFGNGLTLSDSESTQTMKKIAETENETILCLSGEIFDLSDEQWQAALDAVAFYNKIKHIIRDGYTTVIQTTAQDYNHPTGYQVVLRELKEDALLIVHTFEHGANPPVEEFLKGYIIKEAFGSELDGDFQGRAYLLQKI